MINLQENVSLKQYNTFGLDVIARYLIEIESLEDIKLAMQLPEVKRFGYLIIGGGSNILLCSSVEKVVLVNKIKGIEIDFHTDSYVNITAKSGTVWHDLVDYAVSQNWGGIENMSLIPGSVGAAPMQNIGAYGIELKDVFVKLQALRLNSLELEEFTHEDCQFGYRESVFKHSKRNQYFIYSVTIQLQKKPKTNTSYGDINKYLQSMAIEPAMASIKQVSNAVITIRKSKLPNPKELGNAGSFFKNPIVSHQHFQKLQTKFPAIKGYETETGIKVPAGWLIESRGWKGKRIGNVGSHEAQALVLVNYGEANGQEIYQLANKIIADIKVTYDIELEPEVNILA